MTRKEARETEAMLDRLTQILTLHCTDPRIPSPSAIDIARTDAEALRRISMTLHRWHEMECGTDNGAVERETGARKRLAAIMARYPTLRAYVQGDPRGAALYILRPGDVPEGEAVDSYYSRGVAVHK